MSGAGKQVRSLLSERFADVLQISQDEYRNLLCDLRSDDVDLPTFAARAEALMERLISLKRIRIRLRRDCGESFPDRIDDPCVR